MVLGDVEETVTTVEVDEDTYEEIVRVRSQLSTTLSIRKPFGNEEFSRGVGASISSILSSLPCGRGCAGTGRGGPGVCFQRPTSFRWIAVVKGS